MGAKGRHWLLALPNIEATPRLRQGCLFVVVAVGVSFISRFRLRPLMDTCQERPGMYLS